MRKMRSIRTITKTVGINNSISNIMVKRRMMVMGRMMRMRRKIILTINRSLLKNKETKFIEIYKLAINKYKKMNFKV